MSSSKRSAPGTRLKRMTRRSSSTPPSNSGKEFSAFDLALTVSVDFDTAVCLQWRISEQEAYSLYHEPEDDLVSVDLDSGFEAQHAAENPKLKAVHKKRVDQAKGSYVEVLYDSHGLAHSVPAWIGSCTAQDDVSVFDDDVPSSAWATDRGMGGRIYTQAEVDELTSTKGFRYIGWLGVLTVAILDSQRRVIALLGGTPNNVDDWATICLSDEKLHHRRAASMDDPYAAVSRGQSHGGGQTEPGELQQNQTNTRVTDDLLKDPVFQCICFSLCGPRLYAYYQSARTALSHLRWNFPDTVFAACTFNFGPRVITCPHLDFANLSWGWCAVTALGKFDPDMGGHLILWDFRLVIRFPLGSTILLPSAIIRHSNVPVGVHETRSSFVQYTAGGIFRWIRNGFMTDDDFELRVSSAEKAARAAEAETRWEEGLKMFSTIDEL
ncbi:hypothetical protein K438DRAFT_1766566 [Mycena galopus ATCC 62051]|nr:hypothetical protein K438DRAFT_1766566 [Mycena galopus ATCC 62051]